MGAYPSTLSIDTYRTRPIVPSLNLAFDFLSIFQWRSPEEYKDDPLNEAIDIWSLGNNFFALLTGYSPFVELHDFLPEMRNKIMDGQTAFIDPRFRDRSYGDRVLADIIPLCWKLNADDRIDIFRITDSLRGHLFYDVVGMSWEGFAKENNLQEKLTLQQFMEHAFDRQQLPVPVEINAAVGEAAAQFWAWLEIEFREEEPTHLPFSKDDKTS